MKHAVLIFFLLCCSSIFFGQTLVRYGNKTISKAEFLRAFKKNNVKISATPKAYRDYLNLYIRYRLKVQAAYDMRLDTMASQLTELQNFKSQIIDQYTNDETSLNQMAKEAFTRSQRDLRISYIFVASAKNASPADSLMAWKKIQDAYLALKSNKDFGETAIQYSEDPFAKSNRGDLGFITVFDLPYAMESVAYQTPLGKYSPVFRTGGGYVILKKTAERPAAGRIRVAQILLIYPLQATEAAKEDTRKRADSIYREILAGSDFAMLARKFSGDNLSYQLGGSLPEFGIGKYEAGFENTAYGLKNDGDISKPYASSFGYHIIKRIKRIPVPAVADQKTLIEWKEKIKSDARIAISRKQLLQSVLKQTGFKEFIPGGTRFGDYTDSVLLGKKPTINTGITEQTVLFQFPEKKYTAGDWTKYRRSIGSVPSLVNGKTNAELLDLYRQNIAFEYYKEHLEKYNSVYAQEVNEFREGNLLFEIMQRNIWNRAAADSDGLKLFFEKHQQSYWWKPGAEAIIFTADKLPAAEKLKTALHANLRDWRKLVDGLGGQVQADSGRFELKQIPGQTSSTAGRFTATTTRSDHSVQFAYIIREYPKPSPRKFEEARGMAINDYQNEMEDRWIAELKKKYPVSINEAVFNTLLK